METVLFIFIGLILLVIISLSYAGEFSTISQDKKRVKKNIVNCGACSQLEGVKEINDKEQLTKVMTEIRKQLAVSSFKDITQPGHCPSGEFLKLPLTPPWPDYIEHYFKCDECKADYRLSADTLGVEKQNSIQGELEKY